jgi:cytochrome c556
MNKNLNTHLSSARFMGVFAACMLAAVLLLTGCSVGGSQATDAQTLNRQYMANVNQIMDEVNAEMEEFSAAIKDGEVVSLSTQVASINNSVEKLKALSVPEDMKDIQSDYLTGTEELQTAFNAYVDLYEDVKAPENGSFDYSTYNSRMDEIRSHYEAGIEALESADQKASEA